jgi:hypothetical protein
MLRLGLVLVGAALLLHGRKLTRPKNEEDDLNPDAEGEGSGFGKIEQFKPYKNPLLYREGDAGAGDFDAFPGGVGLPGFDPIGGAGYGNIGAITGAQLGAAQGAYNSIVGFLPSAIHQKISNVKRAVSWHRRVFGF